MKKTTGCLIFAAFAVALIGTALASVPAEAQSRVGGVASAARIYGYHLATGNWSYEPARCALMPDVDLLHYRRSFPDGTESRFTAVVPRGAGRVRIVPVLYHNATPFKPAPQDPRNYALFNQLVRGSAAKGTWLDLSACYAALTGYGSGLRAEVGIAGAPKPTVHVDSRGKLHRVTFATRDGRSGYKVWSVSFDRYGRVTNAATEDESVYAGKAPPVAVQRAARMDRERAAVVRPAHKVHPEPQERAAIANPVPPARTDPAPVIRPENQPQQASSQEAGWKFIPNPPDPPSKFIPEPRQPSENVLPKL